MAHNDTATVEAQMQALALTQPSSPEDLPQALTLTSLPRPEVRSGQVLVRVAACGLNPVDWKVARSGHRAWAWPHVLGLDIAGVILEISDAAARLRPDLAVGDRVALHHDLQAEGGLAQYAAVDALALAVIPDGVSFAQAAALPCAGLTAYQAVERLGVSEADTFLVTAGAGAVGGYAVQIAKARGARVIATASAAKADEARRFGADEVIDYAGLSVEEIAIRARSLTTCERGVDAVLDTISSDSATALLGALAFNGRLAHIAGRPDLSVVEEFTTSPSVLEVSLGAAYSAGTARDRRWLGQGLEDLLAMVAAGTLDPRVSKEVPYTSAGEAYLDLAGGHAAGKTVAVLN